MVRFRSCSFAILFLSLGAWVFAKEVDLHPRFRVDVDMVVVRVTVTDPLNRYVV